MANHSSSKGIPDSGLFYKIMVRSKLILSLMLDWRINILLKLIPIAGIVYVISPFDFPGPLDDLAVFLFAMYIFVESCPRQIVKEHLDRILAVPPVDAAYPGDDVIDAEFHNLDDPQNKK